MTQLDSFDQRPDPAIGQLLREHLQADGEEEFVARVRAAARAAGPPGRSQRSWSRLLDWDLPDGWFRPGVAAAAAVLVGALVGSELAPSGAASTSLAEAIRPSEVPADFFAAEAQPDPQVLLAPLLEAQ